MHVIKEQQILFMLWPLWNLSKTWMAGHRGWGGGGALSHWMVVWGRATLKTPFSARILAPETHLFKPFSRSGDPNWIFWKNLAFKDQCLPLFSSCDTNFSKNSSLSRDPCFKPNNQFRRPYFWGQDGTYLPNFFGDYPPPAMGWLVGTAAVNVAIICYTNAWWAHTTKWFAYTWLYKKAIKTWRISRLCCFSFFISLKIMVFKNL